MTYQELKQKQTEIFLSDRTKNELAVQNYMNIYKTLPQSIKDKFNLDENITYQSLCPEAYKEMPDPVIYGQQHDAAVQYFKAINEFAEENNKKVNDLLIRAQNAVNKI